MKTIEFEIRRESIDKRIFTTSAYTARAREAMGTPPAIAERMTVTADDLPLLHPLMDDCVNEVVTIIAHYHPGSNVEFLDDGYRFTIKVPENFPTDNDKNLKHSIESNIACRTLQSWYTDVKPDEAAITAAKIQNEAATLHSLLTQRERPHN